jgi:protein arginine kinase
VLLHLPALDRSPRFPEMLDLLEDLGIIIRGFYGEGTEPAGSMFQISTGKTLGKTELCIMEELESVIKLLVKEEQAARARLKQEEDLAGILREAVEKVRRKKRITSAETFSFLSLLALCRDLGLTRVDERVIRRLCLRIFPGHLQMERGKPLPPAERDAARAGLLRKELEPYV